MWRDFINGAYRLYVTNDIIDEYEEILSAKTTPHIAKLICEIILRAPNTVMLDAHFRWRLIESDPDDNNNQGISPFPLVVFNNIAVPLTSSISYRL